MGIFILRGGPSNFGSFSLIFLFVFKHGLNHPEMQRNFFPPFGAKDFGALKDFSEPIYKKTKNRETSLFFFNEPFPNAAAWDDMWHSRRNTWDLNCWLEGWLLRNGSWKTLCQLMPTQPTQKAADRMDMSLSLPVDIYIILNYAQTNLVLKNLLLAFCHCWLERTAPWNILYAS